MVPVEMMTAAFLFAIEHSFTIPKNWSIIRSFPESFFLPAEAPGRDNRDQSMILDQSGRYAYSPATRYDLKSATKKAFFVKREIAKLGRGHYSEYNYALRWSPSSSVKELYERYGDSLVESPEIVFVDGEFLGVRTSSLARYGPHSGFLFASRIGGSPVSWSMANKSVSLTKYAWVDVSNSLLELHSNGMRADVDLLKSVYGLALINGIRFDERKVYLRDGVIFGKNVPAIVSNFPNRPAGKFSKGVVLADGSIVANAFPKDSDAMEYGESILLSPSSQSWRIMNDVELLASSMDGKYILYYSREQRKCYEASIKE